jgi:sugar phosphate isomerase/epimerase
MKIKDISRRQFIGASAATVAGLVIGTKSVIGAPAIIKNLGKPNSLFKGVQIGAITYSFRSMPDQSAEAVLKYIIDAGLSAVELMPEAPEAFAGIPKNPNAGNRGGFPGGAGGRGGRGAAGQPPVELTPEQKKAQEERAAAMAAYNKQVADWRASVSMDKFEEFRKMYKEAGITIYAWKPNALGANNTDAEVDYAFRAAKALGATSVTVELPTDPAQTKRLGDIAAKNKMLVGYHQHLQATPTLWDEALAQSKGNSLNCDIGHYTAAGYDALALLQAKHDHISSMHTKDRKNKENGQVNMPWGEGDTPVVQALQMIQKNKWKFPASIELEYQIPEGSDAVKETAKCVEYAKKALGA